MTAGPPIPEIGLDEVLRTWSGRGKVWDALAAVREQDGERQWMREDLVLRAHRVLFELLIPFIEQWPTRVSSWMDLLPAATYPHRATRDVPFSGVSWASSRIRHGWPPKSFVGRVRLRAADTLLATCLKWTLGQVMKLHVDARRVFPDIDRPVRDQLQAAAELMETDLVRATNSQEPERPEIRAVRAQGRPWGAVADVAEELRRVERSAHELASRVLMPDDEIRWRLFHLAVLGVLLRALRESGCAVTSLGPLGIGAKGPSYEVADSYGQRWELWFEASGVWSHHGIQSPYSAINGVLSGSPQPLGADLLLVQPGCRGLVLECKYSENPEVVGRDGFHQVTTYALEVRSRLAKETVAAVVGPEGVVGSASFTATVAGDVGFVSPTDLLGVAEAFLKGSRERVGREGGS